MLVYFIQTTAGSFSLPYDTDKLDSIKAILDALSVQVLDIHPRATATYY